MGVKEMSSQAWALERSIAGKREAVSVLDAKLAALEEAKVHAAQARDEADAFAQSVTYFAPVTWAGKHPDSFMRSMSAGGRVKSDAEALHARCAELVDQLDRKAVAFRSERGSLQCSIAREERSLNQTRRSISRMKGSR